MIYCGRHYSYKKSLWEAKREWTLCVRSLRNTLNGIYWVLWSFKVISLISNPIKHLARKRNTPASDFPCYRSWVLTCATIVMRGQSIRCQFSYVLVKATAISHVHRSHKGILSEIIQKTDIDRVLDKVSSWLSDYVISGNFSGKCGVGIRDKQA